jgi:rhodanese-related sulfurtransferase
MMTRFNARIGAGVLLGLGVLYLVLALAMGHSARAEVPPSFAADDARLDVWAAIHRLVQPDGGAVMVDVRPANEQALYRIPGAVSLPGASARTVRKNTTGKRTVLVVASDDQQAAKLTSEVAAAGTVQSVYFLGGGARSWYLALELPAPLFSTKPPPHGYASALQVVRRWLAAPDQVGAKQVDDALAKLAALDFQPDQLAGKTKPKAAGKKKKITGGCG